MAPVPRPAGARQANPFIVVGAQLGLKQKEPQRKDEWQAQANKEDTQETASGSRKKARSTASSSSVRKSSTSSDKPSIYQLEKAKLNNGGNYTMSSQPSRPAEHGSANEKAETSNELHMAKSKSTSFAVNENPNEDSTAERRPIPLPSEAHLASPLSASTTASEIGTSITKDYQAQGVPALGNSETESEPASRLVEQSRKRTKAISDQSVTPNIPSSDTNSISHPVPPTKVEPPSDMPKRPPPKFPYRSKLTEPGTLPINSSQQNQSTQPPTGGNVFGGSLLGSNQNQQQNQQQNQNSGGGLFGQSTNTQNTGNSLFGGATTQQSQNNGSSLFANAQQQSKPQQSGSLFGGSLFGSQSNQQQSQQPSQPQQSGSLFGGSLFGNQNQNQQQQQPNAGNSLFGGLNSQSQQQSQGQQQQQPAMYKPPPGPYSTFGASAVVQPPSLHARSMLSATQYNQAQFPASTFSGKLSMGQGGASTQTGGSQPQSAQKFDWQSVRPTTRFSDLREDCQKDIEELDRMIQAQENLCGQIEAFLPKHGWDVETLGPDVKTIEEKAEGVEAALSADAAGVESMKKLVEGGQQDFLRSLRILQNQQLPVQYQMPSIGYGSMYGGAGSAAQTRYGMADVDESYDTDLVGNYFVPLALQMQQMFETYAKNLSEIEGHMGVMEGNTLQQAQMMVAKRNGGSASGFPGDGNDADDTVRQLADTLGHFEQNILEVAGEVGRCREGVNALLLGRLK